MANAAEKSGVADVLARYPARVRAKLQALRAVIFETAAATDGVGALEETLKWGQVSYLTPETKSGTTIRIDARPDGGVSLFVNCQTDLVQRFRMLYPDSFGYEGNRELRLPEKPDRFALSHCIALALTYHRRKQRGAASAGSRD